MLASQSLIRNSIWHKAALGSRQYSFGCSELLDLVFKFDVDEVNLAASGQHLARLKRSLYPWSCCHSKWCIVVKRRRLSSEVLGGECQPHVGSFEVIIGMLN